MTERLIRQILVVDDTVIIRDLLTEVLRNDGYQVDEAPDGVEAVELVSRNHYDLVITDMHMPKQNGLLTARKIRQIAPETWVVLTDSYPDKLGEAVQREGVIGTICKPFDLKDLRAILNKIEELAGQRVQTAQGS
jgi:two-component system response regulator (stage 0 sporulation protein F)